MYRIDSIYEASMEAFFKAHNEKKAERWMVAMALWFYRQQICNSPDYWSAMASKINAALPEADRDAIKAQLTVVENTFITQTPSDWPEMNPTIASYIAGWDPEVLAVDILVLRADAVAKIDRDAEVYRLNFITNGSGQVMAYQQKLAEAKAKIEDDNISDTAIPHIVAEAAVDEMTLAAKAGQIVATFEAWQTISADIEGRRMAAKKAVAQAETAAAVASAANVNWAE